MSFDFGDDVKPHSMRGSFIVLYVQLTARREGLSSFCDFLAKNLLAFEGESFT